VLEGGASGCVGSEKPKVKPTSAAVKTLSRKKGSSGRQNWVGGYGEV